MAFKGSKYKTISNKSRISISKISFRYKSIFKLFIKIIEGSNYDPLLSEKHQEELPILKP